MAETLYEKLKHYDKTMLPMHMPGHKRNSALSGAGGYLKGLSADCDITEIEGFDNLAEPEGILRSVKERAAALWHSEDAYLLVNGSTCGILAGIYAAVRRGETVIAARNCHKSVYNGLRLTDAKVTYLLPERDTDTGACGPVTPETVEKALRTSPEARLVIITSPTYEGVISDVEGICRVAHARGVPVLVDSAHGAHLGFGAFFKSAAACGADLVVQSLHKTLPSLTQTAMAHRSGTLISGEAYKEALNLFQTSSPSYLLLASIEGCIGLLEQKGEELFQNWQAALEEFYTLAGGLKHLTVIGAKTEEKMPFARDLSKLIVSTAGTNLTGTLLMERLRTEYRIEAEMAAEQYLIAMTGMGDTKESLRRFANALSELDEKCRPAPKKEIIYPAVPGLRYTAAEALDMPSEECHVEKSVARTAAEYVWAYPPGIPLLVPGEEISEEMVRFLLQKEESGVRLHRTGGDGKERGKVRVVR
ncbi:MAG: aminotransferase class V-fold PLP-dependent enzyme [Lachnospiraceae bacterium]|nr:aminotransferase class V-fold PLP-dependent enzyme [Lachnospiraceae bacterium]